MSAMNWLLKLFGHRAREFRGDAFSVQIKPIFREAVSVIYTRPDKALNLGGERIGRKWQGISVQLAADLEESQVAQIARDLEAAFIALQYGYVITRKIAVDIVPESERQAALAELREMGYEIEVLSDGKIRQTRRKDAPRQDVETLRMQAMRMLSLMQAVQGTRPRIETLAKSEDF
jgi:hypothetical protein